jgi:AcrR family transcriptional regulator
VRRNPEEVRERIVNAAIKVFAAHGFFRAPTDLIAREAGVSKGLLFWYFRSKDELILEVARRSLPVDVIEACLETQEGGAEALRCVGSRYLSKYRDAAMRNLMLHTMAASHIYPTLDEALRRLCSDQLRRLARMVYGSDDVEARVRIRTFFGSLLCYTLRPPRDIPPEEYLNHLIATLLGPTPHEPASQVPGPADSVPTIADQGQEGE